MGRNYLADLLATMWPFIDALKFEGGSFALLPEKALREILDLCHRYGVPVSTGGFIERALLQGASADPAVFYWYIKNFSPEVNLFVDHSRIVQIECLRSGIWGTKSLWGRVVTYKG